MRVGDVATHGQSRGIVMGPFGPDILPRFAIILSDGCHENNNGVLVGNLPSA